MLYALLRFLAHACTMVKKRAPCDICFQKLWTKLGGWFKWVFHISNEHSYFRNWYFLPLNKMFGDRNAHKAFSVLNFSLIFIKPFSSNLATYRTFSASFLNAEWSINSPLNKIFLLNTSSLIAFETSYKFD